MTDHEYAVALWCLYYYETESFDMNFPGIVMRDGSRLVAPEYRAHSDQFARRKMDELKDRFRKAMIDVDQHAKKKALSMTLEEQKAMAVLIRKGHE